MHSRNWQRLQVFGIVVLVTVTVVLFENRRDPPDLVDSRGVVVGQKYEAEASEHAWRYREAADFMTRGTVKRLRRSIANWWNWNRTESMLNRFGWGTEPST